VTCEENRVVSVIETTSLELMSLKLLDDSIARMDLRQAHELGYIHADEVFGKMIT
jgi:hypothetical protein